MKIALLALAMMGSQVTIQVSDRIPQLNVEATCKDSVATDKAMGLALPQSYDVSMRDENEARQQLNTVWLTNSIQFEANAWARRLPAAATAMSICSPACKWRTGINQPRSRRN